MYRIEYIYRAYGIRHVECPPCRYSYAGAHRIGAEALRLVPALVAYRLIPTVAGDK